ncbi:nicotinate-nucleotide adenylyltransferase [Aestuariimicrobium kwangyangense]|uniref:nicotinate-nucleotide adenylyltransferase n=1 Tax=Aestuariimicrobium kwangyangense TaxID=396389 RepID=UPI0003B50097|nr:nicotinate-nucleotide adenylyltransferase [Aestuariimicrobium kwangyangense]
MSAVPTSPVTPPSTRTSGSTPGINRQPGHRHRLGVMGGTFDPIHHGHLVAASEVAARFQLDEVVFVPTGIPWQKAGRIVSLPEDRYLMTVIATASNPSFSTSRVDIERAGDTYTVDTLKDLRAERGDDTDLFFITGADALAKILTWRGAEELFDLAHFVGVSRPGVPLGPQDIAHLPKDKVTLLEVPAMAISSTACRERVSEGLPIWYLVPDGIVQYINKRGLYAQGFANADNDAEFPTDFPPIPLSGAQ